MVPLAIGSQTAGSVIRPAAYCGVYGMKPTRGLIPRHGMFAVSNTLDHAGVFARTVEDVALLLEQLAGYDERDPDSRPRARVPYRDLAAAEPPLPPMFAFVKTARWSDVAEDARQAFGELAELLGDRVEEVELSSLADEAPEWHRVIMEAEVAVNLAREWDTGRDCLSPALRTRIERGLTVPAVEYLRARARAADLAPGFAEMFEQRYDAILTPATFGTAPAGLESTGDPAFCMLWTLCGMPAVSLPLMQGANGLPLGVQLVGPADGDARLLRTARWLVSRVEAG
jgi:Asp-tRNA(Asn)/Glu-tRNA(Gln) amidotransferase A subunit family amidase